MDKMKKLVDAMRLLMEEEFSGYIKINFSQGSLSRIEKSEEFEDASVVHMEKKNGKYTTLIPIILIPIVLRAVTERPWIY